MESQTPESMLQRRLESLYDMPANTAARLSKSVQQTLDNVVEEVRALVEPMLQEMQRLRKANSDLQEMQQSIRAAALTDVLGLLQKRTDVLRSRMQQVDEVKERYLSLQLEECTTLRDLVSALKGNL